MLYNPNWAKKKADPMALSTLIAWLEQQPPDRKYSYLNIFMCPLARYFRSQGHWLVLMGGNFFTYSIFFRKRLPPKFNSAMISRPWTYGAALERAKSLQSSRTWFPVW